MSSLLSRGSRDVASSASEYAQRSLTEAVREAMDEAELQRARRQRRRGVFGSAVALLLGAGIGYVLRDRDVDVSEASEVGVEAVETVTQAAEEVRTEEQPRQSRLRSAMPKLLAIGAGVAGLYLLRRRSGSAREMVQDATQRRGPGEQTEAVAGGAADRAEETGESIREGAEDAGESVGESVEETGETIGESIEETGESIEDATDESEDEGF